MSNHTFYRNFIPFQLLKMIEESKEEFTILGARCKEDYAGIVVTKKYKEASVMKIIYLSVSEWNRNTGLEEMFFYLLEDIASSEKIHQIHFEYSGDRNEYFHYIDGLLRKNNWSSLKPKSFNYLLFRNAISRDLKYNRHFNSNQELIFFEWGLFPSDQRFEIIQGNEKWYPKTHDSFLDTERIEKSSLGVRLNEEVIGWFLIERFDSQTLLVKSIYLKEEYRSTQNSRQLLIIGLMQCLKLHGWKNLILNMDDENKQLQLFIERVLRRSIQNKTIMYISMKKVL